MLTRVEAIFRTQQDLHLGYRNVSKEIQQLQRLKASAFSSLFLSKMN